MTGFGFGRGFDRARTWPRATPIYEPGENLLSAPNDFGSWTVDSGGAGSSDPTVAANVALGPDGEMTAERITFTRGVSGHSRIQLGFPSVGTVAYRFGIWLRADVGGQGPALLLAAGQDGPLVLASDWRRYTIDATATDSVSAAALIIWSAIAGTPMTADIYAAHAQVRSV